jgi:hypothetical protein
MDAVEQGTAAASPAALGDMTLVRFGRVLIPVALLLILPWTVYLAINLPTHHNTRHWDTVWAGFDTLEALMLALTLWTLWRRSAYLPLCAGALGSLLLADAWFDCMTASSGELSEALLWLLLELPLAAFSFALALAAINSPHWVAQLVSDARLQLSS